MQDPNKVQCSGACPKPAVPGHILCDRCRIEQGGIDFTHIPYVGKGKEYRNAPDASIQSA